MKVHYTPHFCLDDAEVGDTIPVSSEIMYELDGDLRIVLHRLECPDKVELVYQVTERK